jgi:hypothetical protein
MGPELEENLHVRHKVQLLAQKVHSTPITQQAEKAGFTRAESK